MANPGNFAFYCEIPLTSLIVYPTLASVKPLSKAVGQFYSETFQLPLEDER